MAVKDKVIVGVTATGVVGAGYLALRMYIRSRVYDALVVEYDYPKIRSNINLFASGLGVDANMPTAKEFSESLVPLLGVVMPNAAIEDVLRSGRRSAYWPENRRQSPKGGEQVEALLFKMLQAAYYTPEGASNKEMLAAAGGALVEEGISRGLEFIESGGEKKKQKK